MPGFVKIRIQLTYWNSLSPWDSLIFKDGDSITSNDILSGANFVSGPRGPMGVGEEITSSGIGEGPIDETYVFIIPPGEFTGIEPMTVNINFTSFMAYEAPAVTVSLSDDNVTYALAGAGMGGDDIPLTLTPPVVVPFWADHKNTRERDV